MSPRLAVIGAGPIGLEAAIRGRERGWEVTVLEAGQVGENLRRWGHVRFFTPLRMNLSPLANQWLGNDLLDPEALLFGAEFVQRVLQPLARKLEVREHHRVIRVGRRRLSRSELPGHPLRARRPFELLVEGPMGEELRCFDGVCDATGVYGAPRWLGRGGIPVPGERGAQIERHLPDTGADPEGWRSSAVVVIGNGHSAATLIGELARLREGGGGPVGWLVPDDRSRPVDEVAEDPLPARRDAVRLANDLASQPPAWLNLYRRAALLQIQPGRLRVATRVGEVEVPWDRLAGMVGYRPEPGMLEELAVRVDPAFEGGSGLAGALSRVTDCLAKVELKFADLDSGEPDLYLVGHRSYGRRNTFLLQTGIKQLDLLFSNWKLGRRD